VNEPAELRYSKLKFKFEGIRGDRNEYFSDVREACTCSERFMDDYMQGIHKNTMDNLDRCIGNDPRKRPDYPEALARYLCFLAHKVGGGYREPENLYHIADAAEDAGEGAPEWGKAREMVLRIEGILCSEKSCSTFRRKWDPDALRFDFSVDWEEPEMHWSIIKDDDPTHYLNKHPVTHVWNEACGCGEVVEDVLFICPLCRRHPVMADEFMKHLGYYCGYCGADFYNGWSGKKYVSAKYAVLRILEKQTKEVYPWNERARSKLLGKLASGSSGSGGATPGHATPT